MRAILILAVILSAPAARAQVFFDPADEIQRERVKASKWKRVLQEHSMEYAAPNEYEPDHTVSMKSWGSMEYDTLGRLTSITSWPEKSPRDIGHFNDTERTTYHYSDALRSERRKYYTIGELRISDEKFYDERGRPLQQIFSANPWEEISYSEYNYGSDGRFWIDHYSVSDSGIGDRSRTNGELHAQLLPIWMVTIGANGDTLSSERYLYQPGTRRVAEKQRYESARPPHRPEASIEIRRFDENGKWTYKFSDGEEYHYFRRDTVIDDENWELEIVVMGGDTLSIAIELENEHGLTIRSIKHLNTLEPRQHKSSAAAGITRGRPIPKRTYTSQVHVLEKY